MAEKVYKQAVMVIHGMGEQRPLDTLHGFVGAIMNQYPEADRRYYSRPTKGIDGSYEARRFIIPPIYEDDSPSRRPQTELFEYHWSHLMTDNRLSDLLGTVRRILLQLPWRVPGGLRGLWFVLWSLILVIAWAVAYGPLNGRLTGMSGAAEILASLIGTGLLGGAVTYLVTRLLPSWLTGSFVDVVRYLDTTPRSYQVRADIREGAVALLEKLNEDYDRVIVVAHSLGAYIAYDAIRYLWGQKNHSYPRKKGPDDQSSSGIPDGLVELEAAAKALEGKSNPSASEVEALQDAQLALWEGLRAKGLQWRVSDFITVGTPMYMADQIYTRNRSQFDERVAQHEFPTCPPQQDYPSWKSKREEPQRAMRYSYGMFGRRIIFDGAPFAAMRWTNMWFPTHWLLFGDYFGGPLAPLFGNGIKDIPITSGDWRRLIPGYAHALYYKTMAANPDEALAVAFHAALRRRHGQSDSPPEMVISITDPSDTQPSTA